MKVSIAKLKEAICEMTRKEMDWDVIDKSLDLLEGHISTASFVSFCSELEDLV